MLLEFSSFDQEEFVDVLSTKSKTHFKEQLDDLTERAPKELEAVLEAHLKAEINERIPRIQERIFQLAKLNSDKINKTLEKLIVEAVNDSTEDLLKGLPEEKLAKTLDAIEKVAHKTIENLEEQLVVNYDQINSNFENLYAVKGDFNALADKNGVTEEQAKTLLVASMIDLLKYELLPEEAQKSL